VVWVGNNDGRPMNPYLTSGVTGAAPIWNRVMQYLLDVKVHRLIGVSTRTKESHKWHGIIMTYLCSLHNPNQELKLLHEETTDYAWLNYEDLDDTKLLPGIRDQIDFYFRIDK
jgi:membrane carboxypeptidase/penicillin-binding protein PbpC